MKDFLEERSGVKKLRNKNEKGFTLIELLVVIAIIGLLASVVLLALNSARAKSRDAKRLADIRQIASAMELYYNDCGGYPTNYVAATPRGLILGSTYRLQSGTGMPAANGTCTAADSGVTTSAAAGTAYMGSFPATPQPGDTATCTAAVADNTNAPAGVTTLTAIKSPASTPNDYVFYAGGAGVALDSTKYNVTFCLGAQTGGTASGVHVLTQAGIK